MQYYKLGLLFGVALLFACSSPRSGDKTVLASSSPIDKHWKFETTPSWSDEFNYTGSPDPTKWDYDIGGSGWGNNELEYYTNSTNNAKVENGTLSIIARRESINGMNYSSARLVTRNKGDFLYGRIEVSAKLPAGRGTWPAIWILPTDWSYGGWPRSGEVDIMEHVGFDPNNVLSSVHTQAYNHIIGTQKSGGMMVPGAMTAFHKYRLDWTPYAIRAYYDDQLVFTFVNEGKDYSTWPFDRRFHLLLNLAIGGNWGGMQGVDNEIFPATMEIDYVRVYKMIE